MSRYSERLLIGVGLFMFILAFAFRSNTFLFMIMTVAGITILGFLELKSSIKWATTVWKILIWLSFAPFGFLILFLLYITLVNERAANSNLIGYCLLNFVFVATWILGALVFDFTKVKAALLILNALVITFLSVTFVLYTIDIQHLSSILPQEVMPELTRFELTPSSFIELIFKILTLPYVLASIWSMVIVELRGLGIINGKNVSRLHKPPHNISRIDFS